MRPLKVILAAFILGWISLQGWAADAKRPNIFMAMADDWGWPHAGCYGDAVVRTPTFDRLASEGALFVNAFVSSPSCTPSRAALMTGQYHWRLEESANLWSTLRPEFKTYPELLRDAGYFIGHMRKAWGPGRIQAQGRSEDPTGPAFKSFAEFLQARPPNMPFCFWFGSSDPHRPYDPGSGQRAGFDLPKIRVPAFLPDHPTVRSDIADYYFEVERFDRELGEAIELLKQSGELDSTLIAVSGDNGFPFPRGKSNLYDLGTHVPLVIRWPGQTPPANRIAQFISTSDLAPTFLEAAGQRPPPEMTGRSLLALLNRRPDSQRDHVIFGKERHVPSQEKGNQTGYPCRALRTAEFLYIRNFRPELWPNGIADGAASEKGNAFADCDDGPTKALIVAHRDEENTKKFFDLAFAKRPAEELYDLRKDPEQLVNVAGQPQYAEQLHRLSTQLTKELKATADPRILGGAERLEAYPYYGERLK
jgi:arylsulfatase A-like enzyme